MSLACLLQDIYLRYNVIIHINLCYFIFTIDGLCIYFNHDIDTK